MYIVTHLTLHPNTHTHTHIHTHKQPSARSPYTHTHTHTHTHTQTAISTHTRTVDLYIILGMGIPQRSLLHKSNGLRVRFNGIIGGELLQTSCYRQEFFVLFHRGGVDSEFYISEI